VTTAALFLAANFHSCNVVLATAFYHLDVLPSVGTASAAILAVVYATKTSLPLAGQFFVAHVVRSNLKCLLSVLHHVRSLPFYRLHTLQAEAKPLACLLGTVISFLYAAAMIPKSQCDVVAALHPAPVVDQCMQHSACTVSIDAAH
jgi:hypothetical protein